MRNFSVIVLSCTLCALATSSPAQADPQGFALERLGTAAPGAGWLLHDDLNMHGGLGGALAFTTSYAHDPLRLRSADGSQQLALVEQQALVEIGAAITWQRLRFSLHMASPLLVTGQAGTFAGTTFAPGRHAEHYQNCGTQRVCANLGWNPDTIADPRLGVDARLYGEPGGRLRLGLGAELAVPSGLRGDYVSDETWRGLVRLQAAGDAGLWTWAAQVGGHVRPLDDSGIPGSPRGSELLFGAAAGARWLVDHGEHAVAVGPELRGQTPLKSLFAQGYTGVEALLGARFESTRSDGSNVRYRAALGYGLRPEFGTPEWRAVLGVEMFGRSPGLASPAAQR